jgi:hypothetical protein
MATQPWPGNATAGQNFLNILKNPPPPKYAPTPSAATLPSSVPSGNVAGRELLARIQGDATPTSSAQVLQPFANAPPATPGQKLLACLQSGGDSQSQFRPQTPPPMAPVPMPGHHSPFGHIQPPLQTAARPFPPYAPPPGLPIRPQQGRPASSTLVQPTIGESKRATAVKAPHGGPASAMPSSQSATKIQIPVSLASRSTLKTDMLGGSYVGKNREQVKGGPPGFPPRSQLGKERVQFQGGPPGFPPRKQEDLLIKAYRPTEPPHNLPPAEVTNKPPTSGLGLRSHEQGSAICSVCRCSCTPHSSQWMEDDTFTPSPPSKSGVSPSEGANANSAVPSTPFEKLRIFADIEPEHSPPSPPVPSRPPGLGPPPGFETRRAPPGFSVPAAYPNQLGNPPLTAATYYWQQLQQGAAAAPAPPNPGHALLQQIQGGPPPHPVSLPPPVTLPPPVAPLPRPTAPSGSALLQQLRGGPAARQPPPPSRPSPAPVPTPVEPGKAILAQLQGRRPTAPYVLEGAAVVPARPPATVAQHAQLSAAAQHYLEAKRGKAGSLTPNQPLSGETSPTGATQPIDISAAAIAAKEAASAALRGMPLDRRLCLRHVCWQASG